MLDILLIMKIVLFKIVSILLLFSFFKCSCNQNINELQDARRKSRMAQVTFINAQARNNPTAYRQSLKLVKKKSNDSSLTKQIIASQNNQNARDHCLQAKLSLAKADARIKSSEKILQNIDILRKRKANIPKKAYTKITIALIENRDEFLDIAHLHYMNAVASYVAAYIASNNKRYLKESERIFKKDIVPLEVARLSSPNKNFKPTMVLLKEIIKQKQREEYVL